MPGIFMEVFDLNLSFGFVLTNCMLGVGLAMDAFSVSLANGLNEPCMKRSKLCGIAGVFAVFQALMPMIGWICIHSVVHYFNSFEKIIPWIALVLLCFIGGKMIYEGIKSRGQECCEKTGVGIAALMMQGIATSIDALSVGFTIAEYDLLTALVAAFLIAAVTFFICVGGLEIGKRAGTRLSGSAGVFGGAILVFIGIEIFIKGIL